jgi:phosphatidyl-myo-inositol dimannoside synthase
MQTRNIVLVTLEYPPDRGGIARYLGGLVDHSHGRMSSVSVKHAFQKRRPHWWPMVGIIEKLRGNIILISHIFPVGTAAWFSRMFGGPLYIVLVHGLDVRLARSAWKKFLLRRICRNAKLVIANSEATKVDLRKIVRWIPIHVITPGLEEMQPPARQDARNALGLSSSEKMVVSLARLIPRKGIDIALKAMSRVQKQQSVRYVIIGDGPDRERLQKLASENGVKVEWIPDADDKTKWLWLASADVFLLPVRDEGSDVEGFGIVFLEAARAGIPSIAGQSGGAPEAVLHERTGLLVNPMNDKQVAQAVERLLGDTDLRERLGREAKRRVLQDFRWEDRVTTLLKEIDT